MGIARRVYLYGIALIALGMLVAGLSGLLETALTALVEYLVPLPPSLGEPQLRSRISLSGALAAIGLIAWLIHWGLADRAVRRGGEGGAVERRSGIRKLFLYAALFAGGLLLTFALAGLIRDLLLAAFGRLTGADLLTGSITEPVARIAVVGAFWVYYTRVARSDRAIQPEVGAGATLRRWCVYALSLTGLLLALFSATGLIRLIWETVVPVPGATALTPDGVGIEVAGRTGSLVAGLILWAGHWRWATAWFQRTGGADPEARSVLRKVYLYLVLAVAVGWTVWNLGGILNRLLRMALISDPVATGWAGVLHEAGAAIAPALVFGVGWLYHARVVGREAALAGERHRQATIRWTYLYLVALIGLVTFAVGLAGVASTLVDLAAQPGALRPTHWWEDRISLFGTLALVGLPLWAFHWTRVQRESADPFARASLIRRIYLLVTVALAVLTLLGSGAYALYQVIRLALGERWSAGQTSDLIAAASAAAVTGLLLTYHLRVFRRDTIDSPGPAGPPAAEPAGLLPATAPVLAVAFIRAPDRAALDAFRHTLSARLPDDLEVETREVDAETAARLRRDLAP